MSRLKRFAVAGAMGCTLLSAPAVGADLQPQPPVPAQPAPGSWQFQATIYGWATSLTGTVGVRNLPAAKVDASFADVLENLDGALMGSFLAKNGDWMFLIDIVGARLSDSATLKIANAPTVKFRQGLFIASAIAGYRLPLGDPNLDVSLTAGVRYQQLTAKMTLYPGLLPGLSLTNEETEDWLDPIVGVALQYRINDRWFVNALADIGGFGVGSDLTAQGLVSVGYKWTDTVSTAIGYRALYTDYSTSGHRTGTFRYDTTMHGPFLSLAFHF
ncbi:hypothetical protein AL346_12285 [Chelatococcus sp. CO-6]|uniref:hypothetical protein n=2 Tax=unclassified Chelatococcus TaxID=2638111 RepID=UPI00069DF31B|nr:hypothetical protein [Chelatococcus sp. CO-6]ALA18037.1 hypothetical protein AL346_12285 [Chelatococcus sp. CO-6]